MERIFYDRLVDAEDQEWFVHNASMISQRFGEGISKDKIKKGDLGVAFTNILSYETDEPIYEEIDDVKKIT